MGAFQALLSFTRPITGGCYWYPTIVNGKTLLAARG
jgi:deferrochelatase/peroxidase EfeB